MYLVLIWCILTPKNLLLWSLVLFNGCNINNMPHLQHQQCPQGCQSEKRKHDIGISNGKSYNVKSTYMLQDFSKQTFLFLQLFPFGVLLAGVLIWFVYKNNCLHTLFSRCSSCKEHFCKVSFYHCRSYLSPSDIMHSHPHLLIIGTGFAFGFLVVSSLTFCIL